jgi:hypothetical protein
MNVKTSVKAGAVAGDAAERAAWLAREGLLRPPDNKAAGGALTAKQAPAGPAPPRRSACAPGAIAFPLYRGPHSKGRS